MKVFIVKQASDQTGLLAKVLFLLTKLSERPKIYFLSDIHMLEEIFAYKQYDYIKPEKKSLTN